MAEYIRRFEEPQMIPEWDSSQSSKMDIDQLARANDENQDTSNEVSIDNYEEYFQQWVNS